MSGIETPLKFKRHIFDEVHGSIGVTPVENDIIDTPVFQRLRRIQHLGCASLVYPGASHSRFSHSIGTVFIIDRFARSLGLAKNAKDLQLLRLVALLHDVGHLPFSHTLDKSLEKKDRHSLIGQQIIRQDPISNILTRNGLEPEQVISVLVKSSDPRYSVLIDSDLDVDKMDYLTRDAHHTGVVYGVVDVDRISRTIYFDSENRLCVMYKSKQALENFLLARYYMYSTVYQHGTVASFELMIRLIFSELSREYPCLLPSEALSKGISSFSKYTDDLFLRIMSDYNGTNRRLRELIEMYFRREPLKCVDDQTRLVKQTMPANYHTLLLLQSNEELLQEFSKASNVPAEWIFLDETSPIDLVTMEEAAVRIQKDEDSEDTIPIALDETSIVGSLRDVSRVCLRMYTREQYKTQLKYCLKKRYSV